MNREEMKRLTALESRIREIAESHGLLTTEIDFEVIPASRMLEGMAYMFPMNFSHWSFGRDYEKHRTIYEHSGAGIPYEQVWNFERPRAFLVETNPFALNVLVVAHVYGHVDYFLGNEYMKRGRAFADIAELAKNAAQRFNAYEEKYGKAEVEKIIDAAMSVMWHEHPDPFFEEVDEEIARERLMVWERAKLERGRDMKSEFQKPETQEAIEKVEKHLEHLLAKTPPEPTYDLLLYIMRHSPKPLKPWMEDVLSVVRSEARVLSPNRRTKMLDEGWATYWHVKIMRQLFEEGLLTAEEHGIYNDFHSKVTWEDKASFNWYRVGLAFFEDIKERWDKGRFGKEYDACENPHERSRWDTGVMRGNEKIFEVRSFYSDRMAVEDLFSDEFIRAERLYLYQGDAVSESGEVVYTVKEDDPKIIRSVLRSLFTLHGTPLITVEDGNYGQSRQLYLKHHFSGYELDPEYRIATLFKLFPIWGKKILLEAIEDGKLKLFSFDGKEYKTKEL